MNEQLWCVQDSLVVMNNIANIALHRCPVLSVGIEKLMH